MSVTVQDVRKALEDMVYANLESIYLIKGGSTALVANTDKSVAFSGDPYDNATDYVLRIDEAFDTDGFDISMAIEVKDTTANGFVFRSPRNTTVKWTTHRRIPKISYWTP